MTIIPSQIAIVFPADTRELARMRVEQTRLADIGRAFASAGAEVVSAPYSDQLADEIAARIAGVDVALVWFNPMELGGDRTQLNTMLRSVATRGVVVSAHPDVIDKMGTKEVLYRTRGMGWGCDTRLYKNFRALQDGLTTSLKLGPRVLKQMRGQSGDGIWKVVVEDQTVPTTLLTPDTRLRVRHAKRGSAEAIMVFCDFLALCRSYFDASGAMIDQPYQVRLTEGMIRCYVVRDKVAGFGEQLINALYPAPSGQPESDAPQPGPRHYFPPDRADFQLLKKKLEHEWIPQMCRVLALTAEDLPVLWDADFLLGPKDRNGADTYVLCEINVSSVFPFPPSALAPLVEETLARAGRKHSAAASA